MEIGLANIRAIPKPWGRVELAPWNPSAHDRPIGEIWFDRPGPGRETGDLLLKLLFTSEPLSIQVHPDDRTARASGLDRGKTEAWYILSAEPGATVARGLVAELTTEALLASVADGSIVDRVAWHAVAAGDVLFVPAGTIHALGAGLVVAELQQRSDTTYRLFDYGRGRALHGALGVAAADRMPAAAMPAPQNVSDARTILLACPFFVFERLTLQPGSTWEIAAGSETWVLVIAGSAELGPVHAEIGQVVYLDRAVALVRAGPNGLIALAGISAAEPSPDFLTQVTLPTSVKADI